jgi:hypothetical protein
MSFDWLRFLTQHNIEHTTASRYHITAGNVGINCPWCNDTGFNLHISLYGKGWHCFRTESHKGIAPPALIQKLLRCSYAFAESLSQVEEIPNDGDFLSRLEELFQPSRNAPVPRQTTLRMPETFVPIKGHGSGRMFVSYLERRGFDDIPALCNRFQLRCCADGGRWHGRIIFPIYLHSKLIGWTGRHIGGSLIRYDSLSINDPDTPALSTIKSQVLWFDQLEQATGTLVIVEGPFDALKINYLGAEKNIHATCVFGKSITGEQRDLLETLENFDQRILLLDRDTVDVFNRKGNFASLTSCGFKIKMLPQFVKDPGELDAVSFSAIFDGR